jgi:hypothetical protein
VFSLHCTALESHSHSLALHAGPLGHQVVPPVLATTITAYKNNITVDWDEILFSSDAESTMVEIFVHPEYNGEVENPNDIAIIKLDPSQPLPPPYVTLAEVGQVRPPASSRIVSSPSSIHVFTPPASPVTGAPLPLQCDCRGLRN